MSDIQLFWKRALGSAAIFAAAIVLVLLLWTVGHVVLLAFAGIMLAIFLQALAGWLSRWTSLRYGWSLALVVIVLLAIVGVAVWGIGSRFADQLNELSATMPKSLDEIRKYLGQSGWGQWLLAKATHVGTVPNVSQVAGIATGTIGVIVDIVVIVFIGIYCAGEPELYIAGVLRLVPPPRRERARVVLDTVAYNLRWWLFGQLFAMFVVAIGVGIVLWLIGAPLALALAVVAGILEIIPSVGPLLWLVPAELVALTKGAHMVLYVFILYSVVHMLESYALIPLVQRRNVWLPPALTILIEVLMSLTAGVLGLFVAAPLTVAGMVLVEMLYVEDTLGDRGVQVLGEKELANEQA